MKQGDTEPSDDHSSRVRPSSDEVLRELEVLRHGPGLSPQRIRERGLKIQELDIVHDQLDLECFHPDDTHLAAYSAIGCVIKHAIRDYQHQQILILTLRYDPILLSLRGDVQAWDNILQAPTVSQRDALVQALLFYSKSVYFMKRKNAYFELADQLAMRANTPCRNGQPSKAEIETSLLTTRRILGYLALESDHLLREFLAGEALNRLNPEFKPQPSAAGTAMDKLWVALESAIKDGYPQAKQEATWVYQKHSGKPYRADEYFLGGETLLLLLRPRGFKEFWLTLLSEAARGYVSTRDERLNAIEKLHMSLELLNRIVSHSDDHYDEAADLLQSLGMPHTFESDAFNKDERNS